MLTSRLSHIVSRKSTVLGVTAMLAVGVMSVTTATPAAAMEVDSAAAMETVSSVTPLAKTIEVTGSVAASAVQRDDDTAATAAVEEAPAPVVTWVNPTTGTITSPYGPRPNKPVPGVNPFHKGTDVAAASGTPIYAAFSGTVVEARVLGTYGKWVLIDHGNGVQTGYAHNSAIHVNVGQTVSAGDLIASMGSTGASTGPHLHFEVRVNGEAIDPVPFLSERGVTLGA